MVSPSIQTQPVVLSRRTAIAAGMALVWLAMVLSPRLATSAEESRGEQIYRRQCASCHGANGEGTPEDYPQPLIGDRTLPRLARYIEKSMPEDDPGTCVGEDAEKVAAYIYDAFYSKAAQARTKPPRIELAHLTVRQYRNAVTDLIGSFRATGQWDDRRGLQGEYFKSKRMRDTGVISRVDPVVRFDFAKSSPDPEKIEPKEFAIRWQGSVLAPETGEYQFIVKTENSAKLWVNDLKQPLIDAYVKSGTDDEYRGSIRLLAGRAYPLRLEYFKANQGVDKKDKKAEEKAASIALEWALPQRVPEVIPAHNLSPTTVPESFVLASPFPPDDRSVGYERGTSISREWDQATTDAAIEVADYVVAHLRDLTGIGEGDADREPRLRTFCGQFAERAFRRPLTDDQRALYLERQFKEAHDPETAVKRVVLLVLKSPRFLYHEIGGERDAYDVASRISFGLWDSLPDPPLLEAAASGRLATPEQVTGQAERMVTDLRCRSKLRDFFFQWLKVEQIPDVAKDPKRFPDFDKAITSDLRTSLDLLLEDLVWSESSDFRQLLLTDSLYLNGRLAQFYGVDLATDAPFQKVTPGPRERAGVLTHPYLMASFAYTATSSPIHRGVFIARNVLGLALRPPPEAFPPLSPDLHPQLSTRERVALQTSPESCQSCHATINPLGFALEPFDAVGRFRREENGRPIDATGAYQARSGELVKFAGARDLATFLAGSRETHDAFVQQLFHHLVKQPVRAFGPRELEDLRAEFAAGNFNIRKLVVKVMADTALTPQDVKLSIK
jgi:mono/diheme cytochrome c family protein